MKYVLSVSKMWTVRVYKVKDLSLVMVVFPFTLHMIDAIVGDLTPDQIDILGWVYNNSSRPMIFSH